MDINLFPGKDDLNVDINYEKTTNARKTHNSLTEINKMSTEEAEKLLDPNISNTDIESRVRKMERQITTSAIKKSTEISNEDNVSFIRHLWGDVAGNIEFSDSASKFFNKTAEVHTENAHSIKANNRSANMNIHVFSGKGVENVENNNERNAQEMHSFLKDICKMSKEGEEKLSDPNMSKTDEENHVSGMERQIFASTIKKSTENPDENSISFIRHLWEDVVDSNEFRNACSTYGSVDHSIIKKTPDVRMENVHNITNMLKKECQKSSDIFDSEYTMTERCLDIDTLSINNIKRMWQQKENSHRSPGNQHTVHCASKKTRTRETEEVAADNSPEKDIGHSKESMSIVECSKTAVAECMWKDVAEFGNNIAVCDTFYRENFPKETPQKIHKMDDMLPKESYDTRDCESSTSERRLDIDSLSVNNIKIMWQHIDNRNRLLTNREIAKNVDISKRTSTREKRRVAIDNNSHEKVFDHASDSTSIVERSEDARRAANVQALWEKMETKSNDTCDFESSMSERHIDIDTAYVNNIKKMWQQKDDSNRFPGKEDKTCDVSTNPCPRETEDVLADNNSRAEDFGHISDFTPIVERSEDTSVAASESIEFKDGGLVCDTVYHENILPKKTSETVGGKEVNSMRNVFEKECPLESNGRDAQSGTHGKHPDIDTANVNTIKRMWQQKENTNRFSGTQHTTHYVSNRTRPRRKEEVTEDNSPKENIESSSDSMSIVECSNAAVAECMWKDVAEKIPFGNDIAVCDTVYHENIPKETPQKIHKMNESYDTCDCESSTSERRLDIDSSSVNNIKIMWQHIDNRNRLLTNREIAKNVDISKRTSTREKREVAPDNFVEVFSHASDSTSMAERSEDAIRAATVQPLWENVETKSNDTCDCESSMSERHIDIDTAYVNNIKKMWQQKDDSNRFPENQHETSVVSTKPCLRETEDVLADDNFHAEDFVHTSDSTANVERNENTNVAVSGNIEFRDGGFVFDTVHLDNIISKKTSKTVGGKEVNSVRNVLEKEYPLQSKGLDIQSDTHEKHLDIDTANVNTIKRMWQQTDNNRLPKETPVKVLDTKSSEFVIQAKTSDICDSKSSMAEKRLDINFMKRMWEKNDDNNRFSGSKETTGFVCNTKNTHKNWEDNVHFSVPQSTVESSDDTSETERTFCLPEVEHPGRSVKQLVKDKFGEKKELTSRSQNLSVVIPEEEYFKSSVKQIAKNLFTPSGLTKSRPSPYPRRSESKWLLLCRNILSSKGMKYFLLGSTTGASLALLWVTVYPGLIFSPPPPPPPPACQICMDILGSIQTFSKNIYASCFNIFEWK